MLPVGVSDAQTWEPEGTFHRETRIHMAPSTATHTLCVYTLVVLSPICLVVSWGCETGSLVTQAGWQFPLDTLLSTSMIEVTGVATFY